MNTRFALVTLFTVAAAPVLAQSPAANVKPRAVVELFTSQGCSSCPPADKLMSELAKDPTLIILTLPVDYWDYLGWKDTLAHSAFTYRQKAYSAMRGDRQVYTPQAVVNGLAHAVGSDRAQLERAVVATRGSAGALAFEISILRNGGGFTVECPKQSLDGVAHLWAMPFVKEKIVQIGRGENGGRSVTYVNVVRSVTRVGECRGPGSAAVEVPATSLTEDADGLVVLLQSGNEKKPAQVLAAARAMRR